MLIFFIQKVLLVYTNRFTLFPSLEGIRGRAKKRHNALIQLLTVKPHFVQISAVPNAFSRAEFFDKMNKINK